MVIGAVLLVKVGIENQHDSLEIRILESVLPGKVRREVESFKIYLNNSSPQLMRVHPRVYLCCGLWILIVLDSLFEAHFDKHSPSGAVEMMEYPLLLVVTNLLVLMNLPNNSFSNRNRSSP